MNRRTAPAKPDCFLVDRLRELSNAANQRCREADEKEQQRVYKAFPEVCYSHWPDLVRQMETAAEGNAYQVLLKITDDRLIGMQAEHLRNALREYLERKANGVQLAVSHSDQSSMQGSTFSILVGWYEH